MINRECVRNEIIIEHQYQENICGYEKGGLHLYRMPINTFKKDLHQTLSLFSLLSASLPKFAVWVLTSKIIPFDSK